MKTIKHRSKSRSQRGHDVMPTTSAVEYDPAFQATIKRIGESVSDINAVSIDRTQYVLGVASVVREARLRA